MTLSLLSKNHYGLLETTSSTCKILSSGGSAGSNLTSTVFEKSVTLIAFPAENFQIFSINTELIRD